MLAGTRTLIGLILRRDRLKLPIWAGLIIVSLLAIIPMLREIYGDAAGLATLYQTFGANPAGLFMTGPMDGPTFGSLMTIETVLWWGLAIAFLNTLLIVRHTRQNEEMGAQELILSGQVHRGSSLVAALVVALVVNTVIAVGLGLGMAALESSWTSSQAWLYGLSLGLFGLVWAAIAAVVVQLVESARSANGMLAGLIGIGFVMRGVGDFMGQAGADGLMQPMWLSWLSPFGWLQATRALTFPEWWPLLVSLGFVLVIALPLAFWLLSRRDVGAGILPARAGRTRASRLLQTPLGLTWYLQKNVFIGWLVGVLALVGTIGALVPEMSSVYDSSDSMQQLISGMGGAGAMIPAFLSAMLSLAVLMVLAYAVQGLGKLRSEESSGHLENLLATRFSRLKWLSLHSSLVLLGGAIMLAITGATLAVFVSLASDVSADILEYSLAGLSYFPALLVLVGGYVLLFGILPRLAGLALWVYYGFMAFITWLGPMLQVDQAIMNLSLLEHIAPAPAQPIESGPLLVMTILGLGLLLIGSLAWRRRNLLER